VAQLRHRFSHNERFVYNSSIKFSVFNQDYVFLDHPSHDQPIVNGLWGFASVRNRMLAHRIFKMITNPFLASRYNPRRSDAQGLDLTLLNSFIVKYVNDGGQNGVTSATIHDAYHCDTMSPTQLQGKPWPVKRPLNYCYVGCSALETREATLDETFDYMCCSKGNQPDETIKWNKVCPRQCRPMIHGRLWLYC
jgi:hypothetical protein